MAEILMVEDEPAYVRAVSGLLAREGFAVTSYGTAQELLTDSRWKHVDVIITDVAMPDLDGIDLALQLRKLGYAGQLVLITGLERRLIEPWLSALAPCDTLCKPFRLGDLVASIRDSGRVPLEES